MHLWDFSSWKIGSPDCDIDARSILWLIETFPRKETEDRGKEAVVSLAAQNLERDAPTTAWSKMLQLREEATSSSSSPVTNH
jgi:microcystin degradation protein MlrC